MEIDSELFVPEPSVGEERTALMRLFHENTKIRSYEVPSAKTSARMNVAAATRLSRLEHGKPRVKPSGLPLPKSPLTPESEFWATIMGRRSALRFSAAGVPLNVIAGILDSGLARRDQTSSDDQQPDVRLAPSAGAIYPIDTYVIAMNVESVNHGVYYYDPVDRELCRLAGEIQQQQIVNSMASQQIVAGADALIVLVGVLPRFLWKYGARGYRYMLLEAGHIAHAFCLSSQYLGFTSRPLGAFVDNALNSILRLDDVDEVAIYVVAVGSM